jgi:beta-glucosidase
MRKILFLCAISLSITSCQKNLSWKDPSLPIDRRVILLLSEMTIEEKVAQMQYRDVNAVFGPDGTFLSDSAKVHIPFGLGIAGLSGNVLEPEQFAAAVNSLQKYLVENTHLGIPVFIYGEGLHGLMARGATVFPQAIALASSWDTALVRKVYEQTALESRARGVNDLFSPLMDLGRDPRWGRIEETFGEDPFLVARMGRAAILGLQGDPGTIGHDHVVATAKHYAAHSQPEGGTNTAPANFSERILRENFLYTFEVAVKEADVRSVMATYHEIDGIPCPVNPWLLKEVLRDEWAFDGFLIADLGAVEELVTIHSITEDAAGAAKKSLETGIDMELIKHEGCFPALPELVKNGKVSESLIDRAAGNILRAKFELGLFGNPYANLDKLAQVMADESRKELAQKVAEESIILLKNDQQALPLDPVKIKKLAVIGPNAADPHFGGYTSEPRSGVSVLEGIKAYADGKFEVLYAEGCKITVNEASFWNNENPILNNPIADRKLISQAVHTAMQADAILLVLGGNESTCREGWSEEHLGDRDDLDLIGLQNELAEALISTGKPVIVLLINGRPLTINYLQEAADAILEGWYMGEQGGHAAARVLFGEVNPSGRLPVTFPQTVGQLPVYYNKKPSMHRNYLFKDSKYLYPFGFGLSYTEYSYSDIKVSDPEPGAGETFEVSFTLTNTGDRAGKEVVQLYIRDEVSSVTRPVMELKGFRKILLEPGESQEVNFTITPDLLQFYGINMKRVVEPGWFTIMVGSSSADIQLSARVKVL